MSNNRRAIDYGRKLNTSSRPNCLIVTERGICIPESIAQEEPVVTHEATQEPPTVSMAPIRKQVFKPVVEESRAPVIHLEDLIAEKVNKATLQNIAAANNLNQSFNQSTQQTPKRFKKSHAQVSKSTASPTAKSQNKALKNQKNPQSAVESSPFIPIVNSTAGMFESVSRMKKVTNGAKKFTQITKNVAKKTANNTKTLSKKAFNIVSRKSAAKVEQAPSKFASTAAMAAFLEPSSSLNPILAPAKSSMNTAQKVLKSAAKISQSESQSESQSAVSSSGAAAVAVKNSRIYEKLNQLNGTKIAFSINIKKKQIFAILRTVAILAIIGISGFLAWDTWMTNREAREMFSKPATAAPVNAVAVINEDSPDALDTASISTQEVAAHTVPADHPRFISIPALGINNARVLSVGINSNGNVDTPQNVHDTAWFDGSAKPGHNGAVFINAHTSFSRSFSGIFDRLPELNVGDKIIIERGDGQRFTYIVIEREEQPRDQVDMRRVLNVQGGAEQGLTLMTCSGTYDYRNGGASHRVMIYAVLEQ